MRRLLNPSTNPNGWLTAAAAVYAIVQAVYGHTAADPRVWLPALTAVLSLLARGQVTPVSDPRDGNGKPLGAPGMRQVAAAADSFGWDIVKRHLPDGPVPSSTLPPAVQPPATTTGNATP